MKRLWKGALAGLALAGALAGFVEAQAPVTMGLQSCAIVGGVQTCNWVGSWNTAIKSSLGTTPQLVKNAGGIIGLTHCDNANGSTVYVEYFTAPNPVLGTTAPAWMVPIVTGGGGDTTTLGLNLGGTAIYAVAVTAFNGSSAPGTPLNCAIGYL